jgi:hypothetical protein
MLKNKLKSNQKGFTFAEVVISTGIITVILLTFGIMLITSANLQKSLFATQNVDRILSYEAEQINSMRWDNIMLRPEVFSICNLDGVRFSTQSVDPGPSLVSQDGLTVSITRNVVWQTSESQVACTELNKNKVEPKIIEITATWEESGEEKSKTLTLLRSKWAEAPLESLTVPSGDNLSVFYQDPLNAPSSWCGSYNKDGSSVSGGSANSITSNTLNLSFTSNDAICGIVLQGLTVGEIYTVVAEVVVSQDSSSVTLTSSNSANGTGLAISGQGAYRLTHSFVAGGSSEVVGIIIPAHIDYLSNTSVILTEFTIYN